MRKTNYTHLVIARSEFLKQVGAPNETLRVVVIYFMFKYTFMIKATLLESLRSKKKKCFKGNISAQLVIRTSFLRENNF